jgi:hypothetical protein
MRRRFQFSLKWLFVATAVAAIIMAAVRWHSNRLEVLADSVDDLVHRHRYEEAEAVARRALRLYPDNDIAKFLVGFCEVILHKYEPKEGPGLDYDITPWQKLVDEHRARKRAQQEAVESLSAFLRRVLESPVHFDRRPTLPPRVEFAVGVVCYTAAGKSAWLTVGVGYWLGALCCDRD